jgi:hypothetical protein
MICPYCGKENPEISDICEFCGGPLSITSTESAPELYTPEPKFTVIQSTPEVEMPYSTPEVEKPYSAPALEQPEAPRGRYGNRIWWLVGCFVLVFLFLCCAVGAIVVFRSINGFTSFLPNSLISALAPNQIDTIPIAVLPPTSQPTAPEPTASIPTAPNPTASITNGSLPTATNITTTNQKLLFFDDFSDPNSGWDRADVADYYADYYNDSYRIVVYSDMSDSWANPAGNEFTDVSIEVDATKNAGPDDNDFGVICRYQGMDQFYYAVISSDGYYGISKVTSDSSTLLGAAEMQYSDYIYQGDATNQIRFDCTGDMLTLYANGQQLDQQIDSEYISGNVGLIAGTYDTPGTDILFDNFSVFHP